MPKSEQSMQSLADLEKSIQPLLKLTGLLTGLETTFVTYIDPVKQSQQVLWVDGAGDIQLTAGSELNWSDSMCRLIFNDDTTVCSDVQNAYPDSIGASLGMGTFLALPVHSDQQVVGSLCAASTGQRLISGETTQQLELLAAAMSWHIHQWQTISRLIQRFNTTQNNLKRVKSKAAELSREANTDQLTGLLNRRGFENQWSELKRQEVDTVAVIAIDFDNFKQLNDEHGHAAGDAVLVAFGSVLLQISRDSDICARMGGDEFFWVLSSASVENAKQATERLRQAFKEHIKELAVACTLSIGVQVQSIDLGDNLLLAADKAMYKAKADGRATTVVSKQSW